jgi:hypothetical protein
VRGSTFNKEDAKHIEVRRTKNGSSYKVYTFECKQCGVDINIQSNRVKNGTGLCIRCGQKGRPYEHILNELTKTCKSRGKHTVEITYKEFLNTIVGKDCHYCGKRLIFNPHTRDSEGNYTSRAHQMDRKDNLLGYTKNNVVPCCWECNRLKSDIYSYEEFMKIAVALREVQTDRENEKS